MSERIVVDVRNVAKKYRLFDRNTDRIKEALHPLGKQYHRDFWALRDIHFSVRRGQTLGVIGVNGSGKSTLLQIICGILTATTGDVNVDGRITALLELGSGFNPEYTGHDNVFVQGAILGLGRAEIQRRYDDIIRFADIGEFIDQPVRTYSSGMMLRLAFSVAINVDPDIMIIDEALSVGDVFFQSKCFDRIRQMRGDGVTTLMVSHNLRTVAAMCDEVIVLDAGRMLTRGDPISAIDAYQRARSHPAGPGDAPAPGPADLSESPVRRYGSGKGRVDSYAIDGAANCAELTVAAGDPLTVGIRCRADQPIERPMVALRIRTPDGIVAFAARAPDGDAPDGGAATGPLKTGDVLAATFRLNVNLIRGQYTISINFAEWIDNQVRSIDRLIDVASLVVLPGGYPQGGLCHCDPKVDVDITSPGDA